MTRTGAPVGILGGTFDPIHHGHLRAAVELLDGLGCAEVRLIPGYIPPHRGTPRVTAERRLALVRAAAEGVPGLHVDDRELRRGGPSYTLKTLIELRAELGARPLCFALGADSFGGLHRWFRWRELTDYAHLVVMQRPGFAVGEPPEPVAAWLASRAAGVLHELRDSPAGRVGFLPLTGLDISASAIRRMLALGRSARYLVPDDVWRVIAGEGWYGYPRL